jgi:hypothetical protein
VVEAQADREPMRIDRASDTPFGNLSRPNYLRAHETILGRMSRPK